jgi:DNA-binding winged helix-turn-helix (wHTH) protein/Tol biopolymer transport system component
MDQKSFVFRFGNFEVAERELLVSRAGETLTLEPKALRVLLYLLHNPGRLVTKEELLNAVWPDVSVGENSLTRAVALLRKTLDDDVHEPRYIATIPTAGYRFIGQVDSSQAPGNPDPAPVAPVPPRHRFAGHKTLLVALGTLVVVGTASLAWYLLRPLPPPGISEYAQITHDGHIGSIAGTDGSRLYFNFALGGPVAQVGVSGGEIVTIPAGSGSPAVADVSPDGETLLLGSPTGIFTMGTGGGPPRFITHSTEVNNPVWSPDAKSIAYVGADGSLYSMKIDGTDVRKLARAQLFISDYAWSPDGSHLRFTRDNALWEISSSGGNPHALFPDWKGPDGLCCGRWTPDGDFYLFLAGGNSETGPNIGGFEQIWALDERHRLLGRPSHALSQLTSGPIHWWAPIPSRDGKKIFAVGTTPRAELVRFDAKSKQLQPFLGGISAEFLSFSQDGSQVAYVTYPDGILWRSKPDGTERVQLTSPPLRSYVCRWSPDGTQILFVAQRNSPRYELYTVGAQGGSPRLLVPGEEGAGIGDGIWSPDGKEVVSSVLSMPAYLGILDIESGKTSKIPGSEGLYSARWSPDGQYIAAMTTTNTKIKLLDKQNQRWSTIAQQGGWAFPTFSRNGKFIYALHKQAPWWSVDRISVPDGKRERVVDLTGTHLTGAVSLWFGLDPNDVPLLLRDSGSSDIYALTVERK